MSLQHIQKNSPRLLPKPAKFEKNPPNGYRVIRKTKCGAGGAARGRRSRKLSHTQTMKKFDQLREEHQANSVTSIDKYIEEITTAIASCLHDSCPTTKSRQGLIKISRRLLGKIKLKRDIQREIRQFPDYEPLRQAYRNITKEIKTNLEEERRAARMKEIEALNPKDSKQYWRTINNLTGQTKTDKKPIKLINPSTRTKKLAALPLMDVEKAFDAVWHNGLLKKLHDMELPSDILRIISSFLTDRTIQVKIGNTLSEVVQLLAGTPQGSIQSPLLFIVYVNDIPVTQTCQVTQYADDIAIYTSHRNPRYLEAHLQK